MVYIKDRLPTASSSSCLSFNSFQLTLLCFCSSPLYISYFWSNLYFCWRAVTLGTTHCCKNCKLFWKDTKTLQDCAGSLGGINHLCTVGKKDKVDRMDGLSHIPSFLFDDFHWHLFFFFLLWNQLVFEQQCFCSSDHSSPGLSVWHVFYLNTHTQIWMQACTRVHEHTEK